MRSRFSFPARGTSTIQTSRRSRSGTFCRILTRRLVPAPNGVIVFRVAEYDSNGLRLRFIRQAAMEPSLCGTHVRIAVLGSSFAWALSTPLSAQSTGAPGSAVTRYAVAVSAAEAEGARYPRVLGDSTRRRCIPATGQVTQSAEFESRGWANYATIWYGGYGKLTWWPKFPQPTDSLTVRIVSAVGAADTTVFKFAGPVRSGGDGSYMYPSGVRPPRPGPWLFLATAGPNWGCFLYLLPDKDPGFSRP